MSYNKNAIQQDAMMPDRPSIPQPNPVTHYFPNYRASQSMKRMSKLLGRRQKSFTALSIP